MASELRPRLALTLGDSAGIGPELIARAITERGVRTRCQPIAVGRPEILQRALQVVQAPKRVVAVDSWSAAHETLHANPDAVVCLVAGGESLDKFTPGQPTAVTGQAAYDALIAATQAALAGQIDAIVTAPLNKAALHAAGWDYPGHTEILAATCGVAEFAMMLQLPGGGPIANPTGLCVAHATLHTSLASVPKLLTKERVEETILLIDRYLRQRGLIAPRIGVCALNPHAGESGLFGDEESTVIAPAVRSAVAQGVAARGPFPADTLFRRAARGEFDGVAAMYHDQGHIAFKLIGFERAVNVTLGLPIVRTSPSHGTAEDIAWKGLASPEGLFAAMDVAIELANHRGPRKLSS